MSRVCIHGVISRQKHALSKRNVLFTGLSSRYRRLWTRCPCVGCPLPKVRWGLRLNSERATAGKRMDAGEHSGERKCAASSASLIEVVHAFGSCPVTVRDNIGVLDDERVVYAVGSRVAIKATARGSNDDMEFLSTGLRVARVTAVACSPEKGFVAVCYKAVVDNPSCQGAAYATIYYMPARPRPSRVKTLSYERPRGRQQSDPTSSGGGSISSTSHFGSSVASLSSGSISGAVGGRHKRAKIPPPRPPVSATAEFVTATFSHDGRFLLLLDGNPEWTLLWFEWKTGKRMFTLQLDAPVYRVALSPLDHSKTATAGADGLFRIWNAQQGGKVAPMSRVTGLRENVCFRDVAWLNGDRLVLVAHEGVVILVSPSDVLQEWTARDFNKADAAVGPWSPISPTSLRGDSGESESSSGTNGTLSAGVHGVGLTVVATHSRGFFVGGSDGRVFVFEEGEMAGGSGGSNARDVFTLTRVVRIFGVDLLELRTPTSPEYRWLLAGSGNGEIGLLDVYELFRAAPDGDSLSSVGREKGVEPSRQRGGVTSASGTTGKKSDDTWGTLSRLCRGRSPQPAASASPAAAATTDGTAFEGSSTKGTEPFSRAFAKAMDVFEDSLRAAADAELSSMGAGPRQQQSTKDNGTATGLRSSMGSQQSGDNATMSTVYRPVARGLGMGSKHVVEGMGRGGSGSLSCLTVCAKKPLLAAIAKGESRGLVAAPPADGFNRGIINEDVSGSCDTASADGTRGNGQQSRLQHPYQQQSTEFVEIQIWNYRTKQMLVKYRFGEDASPDNVGGGDDLVGTVFPTRGDDEQGGREMGTCEGVGVGGETRGGDADDTFPVAISLHPSGDSIAVAFPHYVNVFYIVGGGGEDSGDEHGGVNDVVGAGVPKAGLPTNQQQRGVAEVFAASDTIPLATLRSDQREFLTKGMFSVSGEQEQVINCDPVSAVHYSPGGHLLAVVTGKVVQVLGVHSGTAGGRLGRVQILSGHASDVTSFCWGADDRRCWTTADGYILEWEAGSGMGALGTNGIRRGEYVSKRAVFEGVVADPSLDGGVVACCVLGGSGGGGGKAGVSSLSAMHSGGGGGGGGALGDADCRGGMSLQGGRFGSATVLEKSRHSTNHYGATTVKSKNDLKGGADGSDRAATKAAGAGSGSSTGNNNISNIKNNGKNNDKNDDNLRTKKRRPCNKEERLASASTCATTGGSTAPFAVLPRDSAAAGLVCGGGRTAMYAHPLCSNNGEDVRKSSIFVWPKKIEANSGEPGLEATVPFRLTCVRATAFEARFKGAHNVLLAGTKEGMAVAFDWGCLLRDSRGVGVDDGGCGDGEEGESDHKHVALAPSAQVCLHCRPITSLALTADGTHFFTAAGDGAVFMCKVQLEGRHVVKNDSSPPTSQVVDQLAPALPNSIPDSSRRHSSREKAGEPFEERRSSEAPVAAPARACTALEPCVEEGMILMERESLVRLQAKAAAAYQQLNQAKHQARFELEKSKRDQQKKLNAIREAGKRELSLMEVDLAKLRQALEQGKKEREDLAKGSVEQRKREASMLNAMYEKKLALQAESYIQLKIAYEELTQAATDDAREMQAKAELIAKEHENSKREDMKRVLEDHRVLKGYVDFVCAQFHKVIDDEQQGHDKQVNVLRASEEIGQIEKNRVKEKAKAEVMAVKKELRTLSKRMEQQCTREVDSVLALGAEKEKSEQLEARVAVLEQEVRAKAQRLSEWENMTDKQKTAVSELEKLKKALTTQLVEQRSMLEEKDALVVKTKDKLDRHAKLQNEGVRQVTALQKEISEKARMFSAVQAEMCRLKASLQHREVLLKATGMRIMSMLDSANERDHWLLVKQKVEAIVVPILERDQLDGLEPDEAVVEQTRQRVKMQESIQKMREALRQEHANNEQQNLIRIAENLELTKEVNLLRKRNTDLAANVRQLEAKSKFENEVRRRQQQAARFHSISAPDFSGVLGAVTGVRNMSSPLSRLRSFNPRATNSATIEEQAGGLRSNGGGARVSQGDEREDGQEQGRETVEMMSGQSPASSPDAAAVELGFGNGANGRGGESNAMCGWVAPGASKQAVAARIRRPVTSIEAAGADQQRQQHQDGQRAFTIQARHSPATEATATTPLASRNGTRPIALSAASRLRRNSGGLLVAGGSGRARTSNNNAVCGRSQRKLGRPGMRVLLPGEGARDYLSLLKGTGTVRGKELEARVATAEAEVWAQGIHFPVLSIEPICFSSQRMAARRISLVAAVYTIVLSSFVRKEHRRLSCAALRGFFVVCRRDVFLGLDHGCSCRKNNEKLSFSTRISTNKTRLLGWPKRTVASCVNRDGLSEPGKQTPKRPSLLSPPSCKPSELLLLLPLLLTKPGLRWNRTRSQMKSRHCLPQAGSDPGELQTHFICNPQQRRVSPKFLLTRQVENRLSE